MAEDEPKNSNEKIEPSNGTPFAPLGICARCHRPLTRPSTAGGCLPCLIDFVGLDEPPAAPGSGEVRRYSHFEIALEADGSLAELGHGAMGTTYRAVDTVLHSPVALKVIGRNVADSPAVRSRFLREARTAARLRHPNVASVFHYGEQEGECFYVMELVEGETLEARVRRDGPLPVPTVLEVGLQVTRALAAAEEQGLVHRDLKPSNLMLVKPQGREEGKSGEALLVKVIDFGLAKAVVTGEQATGEYDTRHGFVGTPAYASPEQFAGNRADSRVDTRSDIYSLGVTLWYLLCRRTPFRGPTLEEIHAKQISETLPIDQLTTRRVPPPVVALLRSMLAVDPRQRPQSACELLEAISRCQEHTPFLSWIVRVPRLRPGWIALLLGIVGACAAATWWHHAKTMPVAPSSLSVAVLPFENLGPNKDGTYFAAGMQDQIAADLARVAELKVISNEGTQAYPPGRRDRGSIGRELGVDHLLEGTVRREGGRIQMSVQLINVHRKTQEWAAWYNRPETEVFAVQSAVARDAATHLGANLSPEERVAIDRPPANDPAAYDLYLRAEALPHEYKNSEELHRALNTRLALLSDAIRRDPKFVLAYCYLAQVHDEYGYLRADSAPEERAADHHALADVALQTARRLDPDNGYLHLTLATHFLDASQDADQARIEIDLARRSLINSATLEQVAARVAMKQDRVADAVKALEKATTLSPTEASFFGQLTNACRSLRRYDEADRASARLIALQSANESYFDTLLRAGGPLEARADLGPLRVALAAATPADATDREWQEFFSLVLALFEHDPEALARELAASSHPQFAMNDIIYPKSWFEGMAARMRGDDAGAKAAFAAARAAMEPLVQTNPTNFRLLSMLGMIDAGLGRKEDAMREALRARELTAVRKSKRDLVPINYHLAIIYAWTNQPDQAFALLDNLVSQAAVLTMLYQQTYGDLRLNPVWDPLRNDPRFSALVARLAPEAAR